MDKNKLSQLRYLKNEIEMLKNQIDNLSFYITTDTVKGSDIEFPYVLHDIKISGLDVKSYKKRLRRLKIKQFRRVEELTNLIEEMDSYLKNVGDSFIRQILILRYVNGLTWEQVAANIGGNNTADSVRKVAERYLK